MQPTIILNPKDDAPIMQEEIFGPIMPIYTYKNIKEVISFINARPKPLAIYYYGSVSHFDCSELSSKTSSGAFQTNECKMQCLSHY